MTREALTQRRYSETWTVCFPPGTNKTYSLTIGTYPDGRIGEVFLSSHRGVGAQADLAARDTACLISLALQHGATLSGLARAMTLDADGNPEGMAGLVLTEMVNWQARFAVEGFQ